MILIDGVVKVVFPDRSRVPPVGESYQSTVSPAEGVAVIVTVPVPHLELLPAEGAEGTEFTVAVTVVLVAETQPVVEFLASA